MPVKNSMQHEKENHRKSPAASDIKKE